jgi:glycosyltransferase involved in cell wall biosynthesis
VNYKLVEDKRPVLVVIPCFNEEVSIGFTISSVKRNIVDAEIWVIDNCCTDRTAEIAESMLVRVLKCPTPGKGFALRKAFAQDLSKFKAILVIDGDDTYDLSDFNESFQAISIHGYDMVVGERINANETVNSRGVFYRPLHSFGNKIFSRGFRVMFGLAINDVLSGYRVMSVPFVASFAGGASKFQVETELNVHAHLLGAAVWNQKIKYRGRHLGSNSKLRTYTDGLSIALMQLKLFRTEKPLRYYIYTAIPWLVVSILLFKRALSSYFSLRTVPNFPSLIAGGASLIVSGLLWATGMILENLRQGRVEERYLRYRENHTN